MNLRQNNSPGGVFHGGRLLSSIKSNNLEYWPPSKILVYEQVYIDYQAKNGDTPNYSSVTATQLMMAFLL